MNNDDARIIRKFNDDSECYYCGADLRDDPTHSEQTCPKCQPDTSQTIWMIRNLADPTLYWSVDEYADPINGEWDDLSHAAVYLDKHRSSVDPGDDGEWIQFAEVPFS